MILPRREIEQEFHRFAREAVRNVVFQFHRSAIIAGPPGCGRFTVVRKELELHDQATNISSPYLNGRSVDNELAYMDRVAEANEILVVNIEDEDRIPDRIFHKLLEIVQGDTSVVIIREEQLTLSGHPKVTQKEELMNPIWKRVPHYISYYELDCKMRLIPGR